MPEWVTEFLKQSPTLGVCLLVVYFAWQSVRSSQRQFLELLQKEHEAHLASKDAEILRLRADVEVLRKERDKLQRQINQSRDKS